MPFNYTYSEFISMIKEQISFKFNGELNRIYKMSDHGCSFTGYIGDYPSINFHNFDLNGSYHLQFWGVFNHILSFNFLKRKDVVKKTFEKYYGIVFQDDVYDDVLNALSVVANQIDYFIKKRPAGYTSTTSISINLYFDKKTHKYLGYEMTMTPFIRHPKKSSKLSFFTGFKIEGGPNQDIKSKITTYLDLPKMESNILPDDFYMKVHWMKEFDGNFNDNISDILRGLDVAEMEIDLKEMIKY